MTNWTFEEINSGGTVKLYDDVATLYDTADTTYDGKAKAIWTNGDKNTTAWSNETKQATSFTNELKS